MLNLFSKLLPAKDHSENNETPDELSILREQLATAEKKIQVLVTTASETQVVVAALTEKINELTFANEIILNIQQSLLESLESTPTKVSSRQGLMPFFSYGSNDDDDLPN